MTPLTRLQKGARGRVAGLPHPHGLAKRLCAMGLTPGAEVCVLQNRGSGPLIVEQSHLRLRLRGHSAKNLRYAYQVLLGDVHDSALGTLE